MLWLSNGSTLVCLTNFMLLKVRVICEHMNSAGLVESTVRCKYSTIHSEFIRIQHLVSSVQADKIMLETTAAYSPIINWSPLCSSDAPLTHLSNGVLQLLFEVLKWSSQLLHIPWLANIYTSSIFAGVLISILEFYLHRHTV